MALVGLNENHLILFIWKFNIIFQDRLGIHFFYRKVTLQFCARFGETIHTSIAIMVHHPLLSTTLMVYLLNYDDSRHDYCHAHQSLQLLRPLPTLDYRNKTPEATRHGWPHFNSVHCKLINEMWFYAVF